MNRKTISAGGFIVAILLILQNLGITIDIDDPNTPDTPVIVDPVDVPDEPEPKPVPKPVDPPVKPDIPTPVVDPIPIEIRDEQFPSLPPLLTTVSLPIKQNLLSCNDPNKAIIMARFYRDGSLVMAMPWTQKQLKTFGQFQSDHYDSIKGMLESHGLTVLCTDVGTLIDNVIKEQIGEHGSDDVLTPEDYEKIGVAFQAISARGFESFKELVK